MALNNPKILIIAERFYPEEFIINKLAQEWVKKGFIVEVLTQVPSYPFAKVFQGYSNRLFQKTEWKGIKIRRFFAITGYRNSLFLKLLSYFSFAAAGSIAALFIGKKYNRIFVYDTGPLTVALPAFLLRNLYKKHVTIWVQDIWPDTVYAYGFRKTWFLSKFLDILVAFIYKGCDRIFISCEGFRQRVMPYALHKPIDFFPNWPVVTQKDLSASKKVKLSDKFNFTFAGNIGSVQDLGPVIRGFGLAQKINPDIQLNIVGDGSALDYLKRMVNDEKMGGVVFWGRQKQSDMPGYFMASDVMVISLKEKPIFALTVPAKFQTYLAFEKPIFCIMSGEVKNMVEKYDIGLCCQHESIDDIRDGFLKFYSLKDRLESFASNSKILLNEVYDREKIIAGMTALVLKD
ncbi:MAG: glycosyltransferase family 4 protein [Elusimicrobia bacterium]|nr:glycosyltransferase family 4 protein [Elusimicrobiota bacterium]